MHAIKIILIKIRFLQDLASCIALVTNAERKQTFKLKYFH